MDAVKMQITNMYVYLKHREKDIIQNLNQNKYNNGILKYLNFKCPFSTKWGKTFVRSFELRMMGT